MEDLKTRITQEIKDAMRAKDTVTLGTLRVLKGEIERKEQDPKLGKVTVPDADIVTLVKKQMESIRALDAQSPELAILERYVPSLMSEQEIRAIAETVKTEQGLGAGDMGKIMAHFKTNFPSRYDGKALSQIAKEVLG